MSMSDTPDRLERTVVIANERGLHARASARFVKCAEQFSAEVTVTRGRHMAGGTSIMGLLALGAGPGTEISIAAVGPDADAAVEALTDLVSGGFGEGCGKAGK